MKRLLFTGLIFGLLSIASFGQTSLRPQVGVNFSTITDEIVHGKLKGNVGYQFGADLQIGGSLYIQPGANFQSKSLTLETVGDINITKLNVPILIGYRLFENEDHNAFGARVYAGPNLAFNLNEKLGDAFQNINITTDDIKKFHAKAMVGVGLDLSIIFLDLAYKFDLTKTFESTISDKASHLFVANAGIRLGF